MTAAMRLARAVRASASWIVVATLTVPALIGIADAAERVTVRAGLHDGFGRLVFDWRSRVRHSAAISDRVLSIRFDHEIEPVFGNAPRVLQRYMTGMERSADARTVRARLSGDFTIRSSTVGNRVVIDLLDKTPPSPKQAEGDRAASREAPAAPAAVPPVRLGPQPSAEARAVPAARAAPDPAQTLPVKAGRHRDYGRLVFDWPRKVGFDVERRGRNVTIRFSAAATVDVAALQRGLPEQISAVAARHSPGGLEIDLVVPADAQLRYFHNDAAVVFDVVATRKEPADGVGSPSKGKAESGRTTDRGGVAAVRANRQEAKKKRPTPILPLVSVEAIQRGADAILKFNWRQPVAAAAFRRGASFWMVFDRAARIDLGPVHVIANGMFRDASQYSDGEFVYVRLPIGPQFDTAVRREGTIWVVEAGRDGGRPVRNLPLEARPTGDKELALVVGARDPGRIIAVRDGTVGDAVYVVPLRGSGSGIEPLRRFPEFELMHSPQGLAIRPLDDTLRVRVDGDEIVISRPGGLAISRDAIEMSGRKPGATSRLLLDLAAWRHGPPSEYQKNRHELLQYVTEPKGVRRNAARLGLARFYAAHGMGAEAVGVLDTLLEEAPQLLRDPAIRALRGLANYLVGHYAEADSDFSHTSLAGIRELYPWRGGIASARGDWAGAFHLFNDTDAVIAALPTRFAVDLGLLAAEAALSVQARDIAEARLLALEALPAVGGQLDHLTYLKGHLHSQKGETDKAIALWKSVVADGARPTRAKAAFAIVNTQLEGGAITLDEAIDRLEGLKFAWRNSVFEFDLLNRLGQLYAEKRDLRQALVTLRQAVTLYKDIKGAQALTERMRTLFRKFYLEGEADKLEPVVALGLYNEFRELTPTNEEGDRMIRRLAERLIKVDLLGDAAALLDHQVQFRLKGEEQARTGARLAEVLLLDRKPVEALAALDRSKQDKPPADLSERRRQLRAAALMDAQRYDEALKGIAGDFGGDFDMLRAQIYWRAGDWQKASRMLARVTGRFDSARLRDRDAELLLRRAVALGLAGDREGLQFLRERFGAAMEKSSEAAAFKAVAGGRLLQVESYAALARRASELDTFRAFMKTLNRQSAAAEPPPQPTAVN